MKMILSSHFGASLCVMGLRSALVWANARHLYGLMRGLYGGNRGACIAIAGTTIELLIWGGIGHWQHFSGSSL